jgi:hypothetical protein
MEPESLHGINLAHQLGGMMGALLRGIDMKLRRQRMRLQAKTLLWIL